MKVSITILVAFALAIIIVGFCAIRIAMAIVDGVNV